MAHNTPNKPYITSDAIFAPGILKLCKFDLQGKLIKDKTGYGTFGTLGVMTTTPFEFKGLIYVANAAYGAKGQKDGVSRLFAIKSDMDNEWNEYVDKSGQTGVSGIAYNTNLIFVATNFDVMAFNEKGKDAWELKKVGASTLRSLRYSGNVAYKSSNANFMFADDKFIYLTSSTKLDKKVFKDNVTVIDAEKGTMVKKTEVEGIIVEIALLGEKVVVLTEDNKISMIDK